MSRHYFQFSRLMLRDLIILSNDRDQIKFHLGENETKTIMALCGLSRHDWQKKVLALEESRTKVVGGRWRRSQAELRSSPGGAVPLAASGCGPLSADRPGGRPMGMRPARDGGHAPRAWRAARALQCSPERTGYSTVHKDRDEWFITRANRPPNWG